MSKNFVVPARHLRLRRIALTGALLVAASAAVVVFGQLDFTSPAAAATVRVSVVPQLPVSALLTRVDLNSLRAVVEDKQAAQAAADAAAARAAADAAAAQAVADAAAARAKTARALVATAGTVNVWTAGWQGEINQCRGGVDITAHYGTPTVAEHWSCGGSAFPTSAGTVVTLTGLDAGTYRVTGVVAVLDAYTAKSNEIPTGYSLLFQTCRNGDSHYTQFVGLQKIG
jgi:hypothetical protein